MGPENESPDLVFNYMKLTTDNRDCAAPRHIMRPKARFLCIIFDMSQAGQNPLVSEGLRVAEFWPACADCVELLLFDMNTEGLKPQ